MGPDKKRPKDTTGPYQLRSRVYGQDRTPEKKADRNYGIPRARGKAGLLFLIPRHLYNFCAAQLKEKRGRLLSFRVSLIGFRTGGTETARRLARPPVGRVRGPREDGIDTPAPNNWQQVNACDVYETGDRLGCHMVPVLMKQTDLRQFFFRLIEMPTVRWKSCVRGGR